MNTLSVSFFILAFTVIALWLPRLYFVTSCIVALAFTYASGLIDVFGFLWLGLLAVLCMVFNNSSGVSRIALASAVAVLAIVLGLHVLPGFHNVMLILPVVLSPGAAPFQLQLSPDKVMAGIILAALVWNRYIKTAKELRGVVTKATPLIIINVIVLVVLSVSMGYLNFAPKFTPLFFIWAIHNLLFTCLGEEAFFRAFVQHELSNQLAAFRHGQWVALVISSLLFGLVHFAGGWQYMLLAAVAGVGYGYIFMKTRRIEMSMLAHFCMNATHFLLFAYPRLQ